MRQYDLGQHTFRIDESRDAFNSIHIKFNKLSEECVSRFVDLIKETKGADADDLFKVIFSSSVLILYGCADEAVQILCSADIWDVDKDTFFNNYSQCYFPIDEAIKDCFSEYADILQGEEQLKEFRMNQRMNRGGVSFTGFSSIGGAIKGAVSSQLYDLTTGLLQGIGDNLVDEADRQNVAKLKKKILDGSKEFEAFLERFKSCCVGVGYAVCDILASRGKIKNFNMDPEKEKALLNNVKNSTVSDEVKTGKLLDCIMLYSYDEDIYYELLDIYGVENESVTEIMKYFGFDEEVACVYAKSFLEEITPLLDTKKKIPKEVDAHRKSIIDLCKKHGLMRATGEWDKEKAERYCLQPIYNAVQVELDELQQKACTVGSKKFNTMAEAQKYYDDLVRERNEQIREQQERERIKKTLSTLFWLALAAVGIYMLVNRVTVFDYIAKLLK